MTELIKLVPGTVQPAGKQAVVDGEVSSMLMVVLTMQVAVGKHVRGHMRDVGPMCGVLLCVVSGSGGDNGR